MGKEAYTLPVGRAGVIFLLAAIFFTVCVIDPSIWNGAVTGKYFYFALVILLAIVIRSFCKSGKIIRLADVAALLFVVYVLINDCLLNNHPDMHWRLFILMIPLYVFIRNISSDRMLVQWGFDIILAVTLIESCWGLLQLYGFTHSYHTVYPITGSLFNPGPYSGFLAAGFPIALTNSLDKEVTGWRKWLGIITLIAVLLVLPVTMSRAAWLAAIAGSVLVLWKYGRKYLKGNILVSGKWKKMLGIMTPLAGILFMVALYLLKKDSADGRWLIWRICAGMITGNPLMGVGYGRFAPAFGDAQAGFFMSGSGSQAQKMIADSSEYAFNEWIQITVELGLTGLLLFVCLLLGCFLFRDRQEQENRYIRPALLSVLAFATFSYPFSVLPLSVIFVFLLSVAASASATLKINIPVWVSRTGVIACLAVTFYGSYQTLSRYRAYRKWETLQVQYRLGIQGGLSDGYRLLYDQLNDQKEYLFEYAQCLSKAGHYEDSNHILTEFLNYGCDPMVYNCMGNNYKAMKEYQDAESAYMRALQVLPNRHYPLYLLMNLYQETGQMEKAANMAREILDKLVKVESEAIREMKDEARKLVP